MLTLQVQKNIRGNFCKKGFSHKPLAASPLTVTKTIIGAPKLRNDFCCSIILLFIQYYDNKIRLLTNVRQIVIVFDLFPYFL